MVEGYTYLDQIAHLSNCYPDYWKLFKKSPKSFFTAYFAPYNGCSYLLNDPEHQVIVVIVSFVKNSGSVLPEFPEEYYGVSKIQDEISIKNPDISKINLRNFKKTQRKIVLNKTENIKNLIFFKLGLRSFKN